MILNCFHKSIEIKDYVIDNVRYADCIIRNKKLVLFPEEEARQAFISYLLQYTNINTDNYTIKVEYKNLDIAIYNKYELENFQPSHSPVLIIELKRKDIDVLKFEYQLFDYLKLNFCDTGLLTNCHQIYVYSKSNNFERKSLKPIELSSLLSSNNQLDEDIKYFKSAQTGDIESFLYLINRYGKTSKMTFQCSDYKVPIETFLLSHLNDYIFFDFCGFKSKRKRPRINKNNFIKLLSIKS